MSDRVDKTYFFFFFGNEVKFVKDGGGQLICCGHPMEIRKPGFDGEE